MKNIRLKKAVLCAGFVMTVAGMGMVQVPSVQAASVSTDTALAGISLILDKFADTNQEAEALVVAQALGTAEEQTNTTEETNTTETTQTVDTEEGKEAEQEKENVEEAKEEEKVSEYANVGISIANNYVNIRKKPNTESKILGKLYKGCAATIIKTKDEWVKIKSGSVTGWINSDYLAIGFDAEELVDTYGTKWATVNTTTLFVREKKSTDSTILTMIPLGEEFEVKKVYKEWVKIVVDEGDEADNATVGYVSKDYVDISVTFEEAISIAEEKAEARRKAEAEAALAAQQEAQQQAAQQQQAASTSSSSASSSNTSSSSSSTNSSTSSSSSSTSNSTSSNTNSSSSSSANNTSSNSSSTSSSTSSNTGSSSSSASNGATGSKVAAFAQKFVGNPYVYGGTSLTNGTDCSGFTQSVFANFGINIPRTSSAQSCSGKSVNLSGVQPGDLIFYARNGSISHVALYIGGGQVVHASNEKTGIKISNMYYRTPSCARRYY